MIYKILQEFPPSIRKKQNIIELDERGNKVIEISKILK
jgi:hypothetical protein